MSDSEWSKKGGTFSHNNACKEFCISEDSIIDAMKQGVLQYRVNSAHGNRYYRVLRSEVEEFAKSIHGPDRVKSQKTKHRIKKINSEIKSLKRQITILEKEKDSLS
jgi:hypothetical protein